MGDPRARVAIELTKQAAKQIGKLFKRKKPTRAKKRALKALRGARSAFGSGLIAGALALWRLARKPSVRRLIARAVGKAREKFYKRKRARQICDFVVTKLEPRSFRFSNKSLQHTYDIHAKHFGLSGNKNTVNLANLKAAIQRHVNSPSTKIIHGSHRGKSVTHFVNPQTGLNVMRNPKGGFVGGWRLNKLQKKHVLYSGKL